MRDHWVLPLVAVAVGLMAYPLIQAATFVTLGDGQPGAQRAAAVMSASGESATTARPAIMPAVTTHADPPADPSAAARENPAAESSPSDVASATPKAVSLYDLAAARFGLDPRMLRALHEVESTASPGGCTPNRQGSGAIGPFQFKPATFRQYAVDADGDGRTDICGLADSLFSAAHYLKALGADARPGSGSTYRALVRYGTSADRVVALAARAAR